MTAGRAEKFREKTPPLAPTSDAEHVHTQDPRKMTLASRFVRASRGRAVPSDQGYMRAMNFIFFRKLSRNVAFTGLPKSTKYALNSLTSAL